MRVVAAIPACALIAGAAVGLLFSEPHYLIAYVALSSAWAAVTLAWALRWTRIFTASIAALFFVGGALLGADAWLRAWHPPLRTAFEQIADHDEAFMALEGTLRSDASPTATGASLSIDVDSVAAGARGFGRATTGGILLTVVGSLAQGAMGEWRAGRRVRVPATLRRPSRYLDPGVPDHERALARRGTTLVGTVKSGALVDVLARGSRIDETMSAIRAFSRTAIADAVGRWSPQSGAIVTAIVIGDRAGLDPDVQRRLQEAGTYHVIAISGGNIAILAGLLLLLFRAAGWLGRGAMLAAIALLVAYAILVGGGASVDRATLMAVVYFAARAFDQRSPPLNTLALVAGLLVATDPLSVADPAFVLTFGATLAILVIAPEVARRREQRDHHERHESTKRTKANSVFVSFVFSWISWVRKRAWLPLASMFAASAAAEAMLFPVAALVFSRVTFAGLALNFVAIPLMGVAQIAGMIVVPTAVISRAAAAAVGWIAHMGAAGLVWSADLVRFAPVVTYRLAPPSAIVVSVYYAALVGAWWWRTGARGVDGARGFRGARGVGGARGFSRAFTFVASIAALWILVDPHTLVALRGDARLHVTFIDVGQGDSAFVRFPRGRTLLIDAGGLSFSSSFDIGDRVVAPVLRDAGVRRIDYMALTHGDPDHVGGAPAILREFKPREVWEGIPVARSQPLTNLRLATEAAGERWANVYAGDHATIDGVEVMARHPRRADWERQKVRNDDSIVLELRWRDVSILLTGDIGMAVERSLVDAIPPARLRVIKIAHHGSLTSSSADFVEAIRPRIAVVSVGRGNHFGHPAPEVLERYRSSGAEIFRTDQDGAVMVETDGTWLSVRTFTGRTNHEDHETHETHETTK
jgi:competence protein ComEC